MIEDFGGFLIRENDDFFATKVGAVLDSLHSLQDDSGAMKTRELIDELKKVVDQIRVILKGSWDESSMKKLLVLQKVAVALAKAGDGEVAEVRGVLDSSVMELGELLAKGGNIVNKIAQQ